VLLSGRRPGELYPRFENVRHITIQHIANLSQNEFHNSVFYTITDSDLMYYFELYI